MFGRATITLVIGPLSSFVFYAPLCILLLRVTFLHVAADFVPSDLWRWISGCVTLKNDVISDACPRVVRNVDNRRRHCSHRSHPL